MTDKLMYFGTRERMTWIKAPAINPDMSKVGWTTTSQFLSGGASVHSSGSSHKVYQYSWAALSAVEIGAITDYADEVYGDGLIYFLDPFATVTNVLPAYWAAPRLGIKDAPTFTGSDIRPIEGATEANPYGYPTRSAVYTFDMNSTPASLYIPIPVGYSLYFGAHGSATGSAAVTLADANAGTTTATRINYITNPSAAVATTGWAASGTGAVLTRVAAAGSSGTGYFRLTSGTAATAMAGINSGNVFPVVAGEAYAFSAQVRGTIGRTVAMRATWTGPAATTGTTASLASSSAWQTISVAGTVPVGATAVRIDVTMTATGGTVGDVLDFDSVLAERGTFLVGTYFDGSFANTLAGSTRTNYSWQGAANGSFSQQVATIAPGTAVSLLSSNTSQMTNTIVGGVSGVVVSFWGAGDLTLSGMIAQILPTGSPAPIGNFIGGRGHSGCRFSGQPAVQGYSAPQALDYQALSATLVETGAWE